MTRPFLFFSALFVSQFAAPLVQAQTGCTTQSLQLAQQQLSKTLGYITTSQFPQLTAPPANHWNAGLATDWTSGFFPGWLWYMYEQTLDNSLLSRAQAQTAALAGETTDATDLNVGFRIMGSYGNGYSVTRDPSYMKAIQTSANTMASLYVSSAGVINSVPTYNPSKINVIIDNMPALEILFYAAQNGGNTAWYNMAVSHALKTMQNNVRADNTATVAGGGEVNTGNDTANDLTNINPMGVLTFLTGYALNSPPLRTDFSGFVGMRFTVGANALTVSALGRIFVTGNSGTHTVKLVLATTGADVPGGSVSVSMVGGVSGQFKYVSLGSPVTLQANTAYYLVSQETSGGDQWYDTGTVASTAAGAVNNSIYSFNSINWYFYNTANTSYVPANFQYH